MKTTRSTETKQSKQGISQKPRPEIRDNLDSRKNKQGNYKDKNPQKGKTK